MAALRTAVIMTASLSTPAGMLVVAPMVLERPLATGAGAVDIIERHENRKLSQLALAGKRLFQKSCASCHGSRAEGSARGVNLLKKSYHRERFDKRSFHAAVRGASITVTLAGHSFDKLSFNEIERMERYVRELQTPTSFR